VLAAVCAAAPTTLPITNEMNIVQLAESVKDLSTLVTAVVHANLTAALEGKAVAVLLLMIAPRLSQKRTIC
jgi:uncharacterized surface protein with fasciclin (FAS1) repeats